MSQTISVDVNTIRTILTRLDRLTREVKMLKAKLFEEEPPYGSEEWWNWSDKKAVEDIKAGRYTKIQSKKELQIFLDSLK